MRLRGQALARAAVLAIALVFLAQGASAYAEEIAGADRFSTAVAASAAAFPGGADTVVVANGLDWPDAAGGGVLAGSIDGPLLLCEQDTLPAVTAAEIGRLAPDRIVILGGTGAVGPAVVEALGAAGVAPGQIERIEGADRYETAALVASATATAFGETWEGRAFVASGHGYADAIAAAPVACVARYPLYLVDDAHAAPVIAAMRERGVSRVTVLGGTAALSTALAQQISQGLGGAVVDRIAGATRYATATTVAAFGTRYFGMTLTSPGLASGEGFADALAAAPVLASRRSPLLLTSAASLPDSVAQWVWERRDVVRGFTVFGGPKAVSALARQDALQALAAPPFDTARTLATVSAIAALGPRRAAGPAERAALDLCASELASYGYAVGRQAVWTPLGTSGNVIAEHPGSSRGVIVLGAHIDSKPPSPGANDNASGVAVVLELARVLATAPTLPTVRVVIFGAEEISGATADDHHFGSRQYVNSLDDAGRARIAGMISIDMVGYGSTFNVRNMGPGSRSVVFALQGRAGFLGRQLDYLRDTGTYGWSDHEPFERVGIPAAWLEWRDDPVYHTAADTAAHVRAEPVRSTGALLRGWLLAMTPAQLDALR